jgi:hypothetical protein
MIVQSDRDAKVLRENLYFVRHATDDMPDHADASQPRTYTNRRERDAGVASTSTA